jgi:hypothetical protein
VACSLALAACNPDKLDDPDGPADGTPWVFENQTTYAVIIAPDSDYYPDQGWKSFSLSYGKSKTVRVDKKYTGIYYTYNYANHVKPVRVQGETKLLIQLR